MIASSSVAKVKLPDGNRVEARIGPVRRHLFEQNFEEGTADRSQILELSLPRIASTADLRAEDVIEVPALPLGRGGTYRVDSTVEENGRIVALCGKRTG